MKLKQIVAMLMAAGVVSAPTLVLAAGAADLSSCCTPADKDYPTPGGNLGNQNYSSLTQINKSNIKNLGPVWMTRVSAAPATTPSPSPGTDDGGQQTMPIAVDGVIYMDTPVGDVIAVDGATGAVKWKWHPTAFPARQQRSSRRLGGRRQGLSRSLAADRVGGAQQGHRRGSLGEAADRSRRAVARQHRRRSRRSTTTAWCTSAPTTARATRSSPLRSSDGEMVWFFFGADKPEPWDTACLPTSTATSSGPTPRRGVPDPSLRGDRRGPRPGSMAPSIPSSDSIMVAFGNVRSCGSSQDGSTRPGDNLFANYARRRSTRRPARSSGITSRSVTTYGTWTTPIRPCLRT